MAADVSVSAWAQELVDHLSRHMDAERGVLADYRALVEGAGDTRIEQLALQILEDEVRHHQRFEEIRLGLREEIERRLASGDTPLPESPDLDTISAWSVHAHQRHWHSASP